MASKIVKNNGIKKELIVRAISKLNSLESNMDKLLRLIK